MNLEVVDMNLYTLDVVAAPATDGNFDALYRVLDLVPGSSLTENPVAPSVTFDVVASNRNEAHIMAVGVASRCGFTVVSVSATLEGRFDGGNVAGLSDVELWARNAPAPAA